MSEVTTFSPGQLRSEMRKWLDDHRSTLEPYRSEIPETIEGEVAQQLDLQRLLYEAGWARWGWPKEFGGFGGEFTLRGVVYEELTLAGVMYPHFSEIREVIGSMLIHHAPEIASVRLPKALSGQELWCQGFSEPDAGSDLASLRTRAVKEVGGFRINGQKVWQSLAHLSQWCVVLARTGSVESRHRGLSMFWIDLSLQGVTVRPILAANGRYELSEVFFEDVLVNESCLIGGINEGWSIAMFLLQFERGMYAWQRQTRLHLRLTQGIRTASCSRPQAESVVGAAYLQLFALRMKARETLLRLAGGETLGPETSVDKLLLSTAEQGVYDALGDLRWPMTVLDDDPEMETWREEWFYSRATSIFGGAAEVQRDIVAQRVLGLPKG